MIKKEEAPLQTLPLEMAVSQTTECCLGYAREK